jgi:hypothetical protein
LLDERRSLLCGRNNEVTKKEAILFLAMSPIACTFGKACRIYYFNYCHLMPISPDYCMSNWEDGVMKEIKFGWQINII